VAEVGAMEVDVNMDVALIQGEAVDVKTRVHVMALIVSVRITCQIAVGTNLGNLSGLRSLMLLLSLLPHPLLLLSLCRYLNLTTTHSFSFSRPSRFCLHIVRCITQLQVRVHLLLLLLSLGF